MQLAVFNKLQDTVRRDYTLPPPSGPGGGEAKVAVFYNVATATDANFIDFITAKYQKLPRNASIATIRRINRQILERVYDEAIKKWSSDIQEVAADGSESDLEATREHFFKLYDLGEQYQPLQYLFIDILASVQNLISFELDDMAKNSPSGSPKK